MKALTLTQPWASFLAHGIKTIETRSWGTHYRGWIAIHAAAKMSMDAVAMCRTDLFASWLLITGYTVESLPKGVLLAKAQLLHCDKITKEYDVNPFERGFGDYTPGRYAWVFGAIVKLDRVPVKGSLGLWEVDNSLLRLATFAESEDE